MIKAKIENPSFSSFLSSLSFVRSFFSVVMTFGRGRSGGGELSPNALALRFVSFSPRNVIHPSAL